MVFQTQNVPESMATGVFGTQTLECWTGWIYW